MVLRILIIHIIEYAEIIGGEAARILLFAIVSDPG